MKSSKLVWTGVLLVTALFAAVIAQSDDEKKSENEKDVMSEKATFAAGCFWGVEATFRQIPGVLETSVGYTGGKTEDPSYEQVCSKKTGHAEAVEVIYDPTQVSYEKLLTVFFENHDPTQLNRQGPDIGDQYRSAVFYHNDAQKAAAKKMIDKLTAEKKFNRPIVTQVVEAGPYYLAEEYHQQYLEKRGLSSCGIKPH